MKTRIKEVRQWAKLSQEKFGERIGVTKSAVSNMESGRYNITESIIRLICKEFGIDYIWLTTGEGEMLADDDSELLSIIDSLLESNNTAKRTFKAFAKLDSRDWEAIDKIIDSLSSND